MINSQDLLLTDIPDVNADMIEIAEFSHTINGYEMTGSLEKCAEIFESPRCDSIDELRISIFYFFRSMRQRMDSESDEEIELVRRTVGRIRDLVMERDEQ